MHAYRENASAIYPRPWPLPSVQRALSLPLLLLMLPLLLMLMLPPPPPPPPPPPLPERPDATPLTTTAARCWQEVQHYIDTNDWLRRDEIDEIWEHWRGMVAVPGAPAPPTPRVADLSDDWASGLAEQWPGDGDEDEQLAQPAPDWSVHALETCLSKVAAVAAHRQPTVLRAESAARAAVGGSEPAAPQRRPEPALPRPGGAPTPAPAVQVSASAGDGAEGSEPRPAPAEELWVGQHAQQQAAAQAAARRRQAAQSQLLREPEPEPEPEPAPAPAPEVTGCLLVASDDATIDAIAERLERSADIKAAAIAELARQLSPPHPLLQPIPPATIDTNVIAEADVLLPAPRSLNARKPITASVASSDGLESGRHVQNTFGSDLVLCTQRMVGRIIPCTCSTCRGAHNEELARARTTLAEANRAREAAETELLALRTSTTLVKAPTEAAADDPAATVASSPLGTPSPKYAPDHTDWTPRSSKERERMLRLATEKQLADTAATVEQLANELQKSQLQLPGTTTERHKAQASVEEMEHALAAITAAQSARTEQSEAVSVTLAQMKARLRMRTEQRGHSERGHSETHGISKFRREHVGKVVSPRGIVMEQAREAALHAHEQKIKEQDKLLRELTVVNAQLRQGLEAAHTLIHRQRSGL